MRAGSNVEYLGNSTDLRHRAVQGVSTCIITRNGSWKDAFECWLDNFGVHLNFFLTDSHLVRHHPPRCTPQDGQVGPGGSTIFSPEFFYVLHFCGKFVSGGYYAPHGPSKTAEKVIIKHFFHFLQGMDSLNGGKS